MQWRCRIQVLVDAIKRAYPNIFDPGLKGSESEEVVSHNDNIDKTKEVIYHLSS